MQIDGNELAIRQNDLDRRAATRRPWPSSGNF